MIPFFIYYSMFGFQRVGDLIWAFADARGKGFLCGGTAGRTTLAGEGLQHQDGHSLVLASTVPTCVAYDPAYAYEIAIIVQDGIRRMYQEHEDRFYYLTLYNENYPMPPMPEGLNPEGCCGASTATRPRKTARRWCSCSAAGRFSTKRCARRRSWPSATACRPTCGASPATTNCAAKPCAWSAGTACIPISRRASPTSWKRCGMPQGPIVAATDYMKVVADQVAPWLAGRLETLGTDGFGRSDNREYLRRHFEINAESIAAAALSRLARDGKFDTARAVAAFAELGVDTEKIDPARA